MPSGEILRYSLSGRGDEVVESTESTDLIYGRRGIGSTYERYTTFIDYSMFTNEYAQIRSFQAFVEHENRFGVFFYVD
jgi:hypothetical protein